MSAFDDLTLGEVEELTAIALGGKSMDSADPMMLAGAVMWITNRRHNGMTWDDFKAVTRMSDIKAFAETMEAADEMDPTNDRNVPAI